MKKQELIDFWTKQFCEAGSNPDEECPEMLVELVREVITYTVQKMEDKYQIEL